MARKPYLKSELRGLKLETVMSWTYPFRVNKALASFGIDPTTISHPIRADWQKKGKNAGFSAEETAFVMASW